jgi:NagD protein
MEHHVDIVTHLESGNPTGNSIFEDEHSGTLVAWKVSQVVNVPSLLLELASLLQYEEMEMIGYLIDMDGVVYRGTHLIPGADRFIQELRESNIPFFFFTNNSQRTRRDVAIKLQRLGVDVEEEHVFTCAMATARFLARQKPAGTAFVIGEGGLLTALHTNGFAIVDKDPDYVVVGEGRTLNFELAEAAVGMILGGAKLVATNLDPNCPTQTGTRPGCGAIVAMLETATGVKAFSVGKPSPLMLCDACQELGLTPENTVVIGDTMETDIVGGVQLGFKTILVLSGGTRREDLPRYAYQPDLVVESIEALSHSRILNEFTFPPHPMMSLVNVAQ